MSTTLDTRDLSILTQVSFKGAIELVAAGKFEVTDIDQLTADLAKGLVANVLAQLPVFDAEASITQAFAPTAAAPAAAPAAAGGVRVKGKQFGELPAWLLTQAAAKGVTEVWDNRDSVEGTKKPHFKATNDDIPFWPPR